MIAVIIVLIVVGIFLYRAFPLISVTGASMFPTYQNGEIVVGTRLFRVCNLRKGDVIVYKSPTEKDRLVIKRIRYIVKDSKNEYLLYCVGDNHNASYDSRYYGHFSSNRIVCKVLDQRRNMNDVCD